MKAKIKQIMKSALSDGQLQTLKKFLRFLRWTVLKPILNIVGRLIFTPLNLARNRDKEVRQLEIGPGSSRIQDFETLNIVWTKNVDYIADAAKKLPFKSDTFDLVYASHCLEHIPWYQVEASLREWVRITKQNGALEIWVPNGLLIAEAFVDAELGRESQIHLDGWYKFNENHDSCIWANGRIFSYGDGSGKKMDPNWHMSLFSPRFLKVLMEKCGLHSVELLDRSKVRGYDHGWVNLGLRGVKG